MTEVRPAIAPILMSTANQGMPIRSTARAIGAATPSSRKGTTPVSTAATSM